MPATHVAAVLASQEQSSSDTNGNRACSRPAMCTVSVTRFVFARTIASTERFRSSTGEAIDVSSHNRGCVAKADTTAAITPGTSPGATDANACSSRSPSSRTSSTQSCSSTSSRLSKYR
jgi:hypothetical protein